MKYVIDWKSDPIHPAIENERFCGIKSYVLDEPFQQAFNPWPRQQQIFSSEWNNNLAWNGFRVYGIASASHYVLISAMSTTTDVGREKSGRCKIKLPKLQVSLLYVQKRILDRTEKGRRVGKKVFLSLSLLSCFTADKCSRNNKPLLTVAISTSFFSLPPGINSNEKNRVHILPEARYEISFHSRPINSGYIFRC